MAAGVLWQWRGSSSRLRLLELEECDLGCEGRRGEGSRESRLDCWDLWCLLPLCNSDIGYFIIALHLITIEDE